MLCSLTQGRHMLYERVGGLALTGLTVYGRAQGGGAAAVWSPNRVTFAPSGIVTLQSRFCQTAEMSSTKQESELRVSHFMTYGACPIQQQGAQAQATAHIWCPGAGCKGKV